MLDYFGRRRAQRVGDELDWVGQGDLDLALRFIVCPGEESFRLGLVFRQRRNVVLLEQFLDPAAVRLRDHGLELVDFRAREGCGHHDVDTVGLAVHVVVDPREFDLQLLRRKGEGSEAPIPPARLTAATTSRQ